MTAYPQMDKNMPLKVAALTGAVEVPRRFVLNRLEDETGISGTGIVAWGVLFPDGRCALRWNTGLSSTAAYDSMDDVEGIHGHNGKTQIEWVD